MPEPIYAKEGDADRLRTITVDRDTKFEQWLEFARERWPILRRPEAERAALDAWDAGIEKGLDINY